ncbi:MAG: asparagine--tRNA ligase [Patescibacteria group bacterium]
MTQTFIKDFKNFKDKEVSIKGWVYNLRSSGSIMFLQVRDGSGFVQAVVSKKEVDAKVWEEAKKITTESSVELSGKVTEHPKQKGVFELQVLGVKVIQVAAEYPIGKKEHGPEFLLDNRHLWLRSPKQWAVLRVRNTIINATYEYLNKEGFIKVDAPILTPVSCEDTTTLFETDYFDLGKAYLSQSGQLYIEAAIFSVGRCFDFGPTFRAEKSKTRRHLTEFWMMDAEAAFVEHEENMKIQEGLICFIIKKVLEQNQYELGVLERDVEALKKIKAPFGRMTHAEAVKKLQSLGSDIKKDDDLGADDETLLTKESAVPIFVEKWPAKIKAFYMKIDPENNDVVLGSDLIAPEGAGEIIGGSQREDDYDSLLKRMKAQKMPIESFQWYLDLRKYGSVPHSGFGYGLERLVRWICGLQHIRETIPFPRMINRLTP